MNISDPFTLLIAATVAGILLGIFLCRLFYRARIDKAYAEGKAEFESQKADLSRDLNVELSKMRTGLLHTLEAYEGAVRSVEEKLQPFSEPLESIEAPAAPLELEHQGPGEMESLESEEEGETMCEEEGSDSEPPIETSSEADPQSSDEGEPENPVEKTTSLLSEAAEELPVNGHSHSSAGS